MNSPDNVVDFNAEYRKRRFNDVDASMAHHPAGKGRNELSLTKDKQHEVREFIDNNRTLAVQIFEELKEQSGGAFTLSAFYEKMQATLEDRETKRVGRAVIEAILNDDDDADPETLVFGDGQDD